MNDKTLKDLKELRKERKRKLKRDNIIKFAEQSFIEQGFDSTIIDQVALDAGYTKATIYNYFESKEDLLTAVLAKDYEVMFNVFKKYIEQPRKTSGVRTIGDAYLTFLDNFPGQASLLDSGRCVTINRTIIQKEENRQTLTESEQEFTENETKVGMLTMDLLAQTIKESGIEGKVEPLRIVKVLSAFMPVIRELVRRGNVGGQSKKEIKETLDVLFTIIENGVKNYAD